MRNYSNHHRDSRTSRSPASSRYRSMRNYSSHHRDSMNSRNKRREYRGHAQLDSRSNCVIQRARIEQLNNNWGLAATATPHRSRSISPPLSDEDIRSEASLAISEPNF
jgi:hypothetical protein